ncbi:hypothetical protein CYMTET_52620 [Cymbomonas tetramitiformis]|uniref:Uncharacterized protein n=1 Tax=Cymbomonas tetramitiformis TaxID=36881 RepID=A0AAE0BK28_9CHLO|nr:hypothetical protein CYMTET_52620 [Cymbomonas tetramitiformis]
MEMYDKALLSTKIRKRFGKHGWFDGEVVSVDAKLGYRVVYSDGDSEDIGADELRAGQADWESRYKGPPKTHLMNTRKLRISQQFDHVSQVRAPQEGYDPTVESDTRNAKKNTPSKRQRAASRTPAEPALRSPPSSKRHRAGRGEAPPVVTNTRSELEPETDEMPQPASAEQPAVRAQSSPTAQEPDVVLPQPAAASQPSQTAHRVDDSDDDCEIIEPEAAVHQSEPSHVEEMPDDLLVTGEIHHCDVLMDFPHPREYCAKHPFTRRSPGTVPSDTAHPNQAACENCFCYVCNSPAMTCTDWLEHCDGYHSSPAWRALRDARQLQKQAASSSAAPQPGTSGQRPTYDAAHQSAGISASSPEWACRRTIADNGEHGHTEHTVESLGAEVACSSFLELVPQVWPEEAPAPAQLTVERLRPYQKQSLAFALAREQAADSKGCGAGGWICDEVGMGKTIVCTAIVLANAMSPKVAAAGASWSILTEFRQRCEDARVPVMEPATWMPSRTTLVNGVYVRTSRIANPQHAKWQQVSKPPGHLVIHIKTTLVMVPVSLLGQWKDELKKFAPALNVKTYHGSNQAELNLLQRLDLDLRDVDVLLVSTKCTLPPLIYRHVRFHRVIVDESHSGMPTNVFYLKVAHRWLCTATPFTSSLRELDDGIRFLQNTHPRTEWAALHKSICNMNVEVDSLNRSLADSHHQLYRTGVLSCHEINQLRRFVNPTTGNQIGRAQFSFHNWPEEKARLPGYVDTLLPGLRERRAEVVTCLQAVMIRHTKAQQIGGDVALTLPPLELDTEFIPMTADEERSYAQVVREEMDERSGEGSSQLRRQLAGGTTDYGLQRSLARRMQMCAAAQSKLEALVADVRGLRAAEPHMHCVVFTQHRLAHDQVAERLKREGVQVYKFSGDTTVTTRHAYIRKFQAMEPVPKAFVAMVRQGNCGVTLTAATRVYLMEPCINPALEVQAAGRVHRLGQSRGVLIKRFAMKDTFEENIVDLHCSIRAGTTNMFHKRITKQVINQIVSK